MELEAVSWWWFILPVDISHGKGLGWQAYKASISMGVLYDEGAVLAVGGEKKRSISGRGREIRQLIS